MTPDQITALFTRADGQYLFARWGRPIVPVVFGVSDGTLAVLKGAIEAVVQLAGHRIAEVDTELGANLMLFFCADWTELQAVPGLNRLVPELPDLVDRLIAADANQYRIFRFDPAGAIRACFGFVRMDAHLSAVPIETVALSQAVQIIVLWSDRAFLADSPLQILDGVALLKRDVGAVIRAGYDRVLPDMSRDPSHGLRLAARVGVQNG